MVKIMSPVPSTRKTDPYNSYNRCLKNGVTIEKKSWDRIIKAVNSKNEFGGNFFYDKKTNSLKIEDSTTVRGKFDNVTIPHGKFEFHTHPSLCDGKICALGIPSPADIIIHLEDVNRETMCHFVFEKSGTWLQISSVKLRGKGKKLALQGAMNRAHDMEKILIMHSATDPESKLRKRWIQAARGVGICMIFVPHTVNKLSPVLSIPVSC